MLLDVAAWLCTVSEMARNTAAALLRKLGSRLLLSLITVSVVGVMLLPSAQASRDEVADALEEVARTQQELITTSAALDEALRRLSETNQEKLRSLESSAAAARALSASRMDAANNAAASYVGGDRDDTALLGMLSAKGVAAQTMLRAVADGRQEVVLQNAEAWKGADSYVRTLAASMVEVELDVQRAAAALQSARRAAFAAIEELTRAQQREAERRLLASGATSAGIPHVAMQAYQNASEWALGAASCDAPWWAIAAVGRHESHHGSYLAALLEDGSVVPRLFGIPLDGTRSLVVRDTDDGAMDEDDVWDRAIGPMQVLPQTWTWYAKQYDFDADGNSVEDPHNINDAARLTAAMLCRNGGDLRTEAGLRRGYWGYNPSQGYNDVVFATAMEYAKLGAR